VSALLAAVVVLGPLVGAVWFALAGLSRRWLAWPWIVGSALAVVPAAYLAFQSACHHIGGRCPPSTVLASSHLAVVGLVALVAGMAVAALTRRATMAIALIAFGELWMIDRLAVTGQTFAAELVAVALVAGVVVEAQSMRLRTRTSPP
jgi:hypothetical protein